MSHPLDKFMLIDKKRLEVTLRQLKRARHYCENAGSVDYADPHQEPTSTWPGATGYARSAIGETLYVLEHLIDGAKLHE